ncbi:FadR/GntR family transcriptional regulator [Pseudomonas sp. S1(2024)]|uniref:FadR/GntR family transcriptional regulator n=1 Tax=Pseudomonas sp. S1(2024) TaxID=3390191 RepID=UPI00397ADCF8
MQTTFPGSSVVSSTKSRHWISSTIDAIRLRIANQTLRVGDRLPAEAELLEQIGGSLNTVRQAVRTLVNWQFLEFRPGDGLYIGKARQSVEAWRQHNRTGIRDHLEMQYLLEVDAARLAARRRNMNDIRRLRECLALRGEYSTNDNLDDFIIRDRELHMAIAVASHNLALQTMYRSFSVLMRSHMFAIFADGQLLDIDFAAHNAVVESIIYGDEEAAVASVKAMLIPPIEQLNQLLGNDSGALTQAERLGTMWV